MQTYRWEYVIDTEKGVYVDSRTLNKKQLAKYFGRPLNEDGKRDDLNFRQKT